VQHVPLIQLSMALQIPSCLLRLTAAVLLRLVLC
jgi:hypothetical protein